MSDKNVDNVSSMNHSTEIATGFQKREGTTDRRSDYINLMITHLSIQLAMAGSINNFELSSGDKKHGNFNDIIVDVTDKTRKKYSIQFRYSQKSVGISVDNFTSQGKFGIRRTFDNFKNNKSVLENSDLIFFTNMKLESSEQNWYDFRISNKKSVVDNQSGKIDRGGPEKYNSATKGEEQSEIHFKLKLVKLNFETELLIKLGITNMVYQFQICLVEIERELTADEQKLVEEYEFFFSKFYLYTDQKLVEEMETVVEEDLNRVFNCKNPLVYRVYKDFITRWSKRDDSKPRLNKAIVRVKLAESLVVPYVVVDSQITADVEKYHLIRKAILNSDITLVDTTVGFQAAKIVADTIINCDWEESNENIKKEFHATGKKYEVFNKNYNPEDFGHRTRVLWHMNLVPLVIQVDQNSAEHVFAALHLCKCRGSRRKFVLIGNQIERKFLDVSWTIFQNLHDLLFIDPEIYEKIIQDFKISLQGRTPIAVTKLVEENVEMAKAITTKEIIEMIDKPVQAGEEKEEIIDYYLDRSVKKVLVDLKFIVNVDDVNISVVSCKGMLRKLRKLVKNKALIDVHEYLSADDTEISMLLDASLRKIYMSRSKFIVVAENEISEEEFEKICKVDPQKIYHHFKMEQVNFEWLASNGSLDAMSKYQVEPSSMMESKIFHYSSSKVKIICADPGMGKTVMINYLKNNYPIPVWVSKFCPNHHFKFFETSQTPTQVLDYIFNSTNHNYNIFDINVREALKKHKKIVILWDGLDEIPQSCVKFVLEAIEALRSLELVQFVSARRHLQRTLQEKFQTFSLTIEPFDKTQQTIFIRKRLTPGCSEETIAQITQNVIDNANVIPEGFLGTPLQIFFLTELFLRNSEKYGALINNILPITETYCYFVEEKFNFLHEKANCSINNYLIHSIVEDNKKYLLPIYEIAGLAASLHSEDFESLQLDDSCLEEIAKEGDGFGIVIQVSERKVPVFAHNSYGEYFSAVWLEKNFDKVRDLSFLFKTPYRNIQFMFDMIMANDCPCHLAVLYRNFTFLRQNTRAIFRKDKGGRTPLHIASSWGAKFPRIETANFGSCYIVDFNRANDIEEENEEFVTILVYLINMLNFQDTDNVFGWNCIEYADRALCLLPLEAFMRLKPHELKNWFNQLTDHQSVTLGIRRRLQNYADICSIVYYSALENYRSLWNLVEKIPYFEDENGNNMIHETAKYDRKDCLEKILKLTNADINSLNNEGNNALHYAAASGHIEVVEFLTRNGINVNKVNNAGLTPLHLAILQEHHNVVNFFLNNTSASLDDYQGLNILRLAAYHGDLEMVKLFVLNLIDVDATSADSNNILHVAAYRGYLEIVKFLIASGVNINATNERGYNALLLACDAGNLEMAKILLDNKSNIEQRADNGMTSLLAAANKGHYEIVQLLIDSGSDISVTSTDGSTALHLAAFKGFLNVVTLLLHYIDINAKTLDGSTSLFLAAINGNLEVVKLLIARNCEISARRDGGISALNCASFEGHADIVQILIESGSEVNETTNDKMNALHLAAMEGHFEVVKILVNTGIKLNEVTQKGSNALHLAMENGYLEIVRFLIKNGMNINGKNANGMNLLHIAAGRNNFEVAKFVIDDGIDLNATNDEGDNALQISVENGHLELVRLLVEKGADLSSARYGSNLLHLAAGQGKLEVVKFLLENGFDVNSRAMQGQNSLYLAAENGHLDVVRFLVSKGIVVEATREDKYNALQVAAIDGNCEVVEFLIDYIDVNSLTHDNETALHISSEHGHLNVVQVLIQEGINVNVFDKYAKFNALHFAVSREHADIVECLLGTDIHKDATDLRGNSCLHIGVGCDNLAIPQMLVDYGININAANDEGNTALHLAILQKRCDIAQLLIYNGIYLNAINKNGLNALHLASLSKNIKLVQALIEGGIYLNATTSRKQNALHLSLSPPIDLGIVNCLLENGIEINAVDDCGLNAIFLVVIAGNVELFAMLIAGYGAEINSIDRRGNNLLHYAVEVRNDIFCRILLDLNCDVNAINEDGDSPLHQAVRNGKIEIVKDLVNKGAKTDLANNNGETPYSLALFLGCTKISTFLHENII